jgi:hypothetical protein
VTDPTLLASLTDLIGKLADILLALVNLYGVVVIAVIGWIVNTGKDGPGVGWFRVMFFTVGFAAFFAAHFAGVWFVYDRLQAVMAEWSQLAGERYQALAWLPPREWLAAIWALNAVILLLAGVLLRQGGYGRAEP